MKFQIRHSIPGRVRVSLEQSHLTDRQADMLAYYFQSNRQITRVKVYERTGSVAIWYDGDRKSVLRLLSDFSYETVSLPKEVEQTSARALNRAYREKMIMHVVRHYGARFFLPPVLGYIRTIWQASRYVWAGLKSLKKGKLEVSVLDGTAIAVSVLRGDFQTAASVMFMLGIGEVLEEWTHKKSVGDLARSMSLHITQVWIVGEDGRTWQVSADEVKENDRILVHMGSVVPFDGTVISGEGAVNQASLTGESMPVYKRPGATVYAGTVLEEGELCMRVLAAGKKTRYEKIMRMIEDTERLKSNLESRAEHMADRLVPYTLGGTALVWLLTRNVTKALSVLMVDFSCALKLATPIAVLSAIREAGERDIMVKGGRFMESVSDADTIVFDKTGTITMATPVVKKVVAFCDRGDDIWQALVGGRCDSVSEDRTVEDELLRTAACLEEHFPHSMARAVVREAKRRRLDHEELHSRVEYIVAHGISSRLGEHRIIIGSRHFVFEDEGAAVPEGKSSRLDGIKEHYSRLYMAIDGKLATVICIEDPIRPEAVRMVGMLRASGIKRAVMMTGDSYQTAQAVAKQVGVDAVYAEVLPGDKAQFVLQEKKNGHTVIMVGDGLNDSPALSAADVGIAVSDGSELAREIADITVPAEDLCSLVTLRQLSMRLMGRIGQNYRRIVGINGALIALGVLGWIMPATSAMLHNASTLWISMQSMRPLLKKEDDDWYCN